MGACSSVGLAGRVQLSRVPILGPVVLCFFWALIMLEADEAFFIYDNDCDHPELEVITTRTAAPERQAVSPDGLSQGLFRGLQRPS